MPSARPHRYSLAECVDRAGADIAIDDAESAKDEDGEMLVRVAGRFGRPFVHVGPLTILHLAPFNCIILATPSSRPR